MTIYDYVDRHLQDEFPYLSEYHTYVQQLNRNESGILYSSIYLVNSRWVNFRSFPSLGNLSKRVSHPLLLIEILHFESLF